MHPSGHAAAAVEVLAADEAAHLNLRPHPRQAQGSLGTRHAISAGVGQAAADAGATSTAAAVNAARAEQLERPGQGQRPPA